jgi:hypothetical protein
VAKSLDEAMEDAAMARLPRRRTGSLVTLQFVLLVLCPSPASNSGLDRPNLARFSLFKLGAADLSRDSPRKEFLWETETQRATLTPAHFTLHNCEIVYFDPLCEMNQR